jgi:very-short-patch-repair endonuclease
MLSHETAAEVHGFADKPSGLIHVTVPARRRPAQRKQLRGIVIHRSDQSQPDLRPPWQPPRTTVADTVLDLIATARTFDDAYGWISRALGQQRTATPALREALARRRRMRWRTWIMEALDDADEGINSPLERRYVHGVERAHGLPTARRQAKRRRGSGNRYLDNLYEEYGVCVELDGAAAHPAEGRWKDTRRDNASLAEGANTLRYGWPDVTENRCYTALQVADVLCNHSWTGQIRPCGPGCPAGRAS